MTVPSGFTIASITRAASSQCPQSNNANLCLQFFTLAIYSTPACRFDGTYTWTFDVGCAPGGDCSRIDPAFTTYSVTTTHTSENFCAEFTPKPFEPFRPTFSLLLPITGVRPFGFQAFTTLNQPYTFTGGAITPPAGMTAVSFTEANGSPNCDADAGVCRQWWDTVIDPGTQCSPRGDYTATFDVGCIPGGNCDPNITTWSITGGVQIQQPNQCPDAGP